MTKWQLNFHFLQHNTLFYLVYSVVTWFSKWQHVCENLFYRNEMWRLFQILSPCSTENYCKNIYFRIVLLLQWSNVFYFVTKWFFQSNFSFFHNDSHLSNFLLKTIFQIFTSTMSNIGVFDFKLEVFKLIISDFYFFRNDQSFIFWYKIFIQVNKYPYIILKGV